MPELDIRATASSNMTDRVEDVEIGTSNIDGISDQKETEWMNSDWSKQLQIFRIIPEFNIALTMRAIWTVGNEVEADPETKLILDGITSWGKGTFREVLKNMTIVRRFGQDAYAEIVRSPESGEIINLKPLNTGNIKQIYNREGILERYEQMDPTDTSKLPKKFKTQEIFHLTNKRIADEIHGIADSEALDKIIKASNESFEDMRQLMHRFVKPILHVVLDEDDDAKIDAFIAKFDSIRNKGENLFTPKGTVDSVDIIAVPANATLNSLPWRESLRNYFYQVMGMPQIVMGGAAEFSESSAKIAYLAFENSVKDEQSDIVEQVWDQLALRIKLTFPASLQNELLSDEAKDASEGTTAAQPADTVTGEGE